MRGSGTPPAVAGAFCFSENSGVANLATVERKGNAGPSTSLRAGSSTSSLLRNDFAQDDVLFVDAVARETRKAAEAALLLPLRRRRGSQDAKSRPVHQRPQARLM